MRYLKSIAARVLSVTVVAVVTVAGMQAPASAHDFTRNMKDDWNLLGTVSISNYHKTITVCDTRADGHGAWVAWYDGFGNYHETIDANGSASGCGSATSFGNSAVLKFNGIIRDVMETGWGTVS